MGGAPSKHPCLIGPVDTWASLPLDLLLEIFRRLESTAVIRCAAVCKPWRRAIIGNASFLRPRPDRFLPSLLLGIFHGINYYEDVLLRRTAGPLQSALPLSVTGYRESAQSFIPAAAAAADGKSPHDYGSVLSSRDGFILLGGRRWRMRELCLCNPMTGDCTFVPEATIRYCTYILLTGYDLSIPTSASASDDDLAVRILAVDGSDEICSEDNRMTYQLLSFTSGGSTGVWGPVRRSMEMQQDFWVVASGRSMVVCCDVVYWLGGRLTHADRESARTVALDVHTGRTWITELPEKTSVNDAGSTLLATTGDGRLSLIRLFAGRQINVWVLNGGDRWSLQQTVDVYKQLRVAGAWREGYFTHIIFNAFCPRSGCVLAIFANQEIRIDLEIGSCPRFECIGESKGYHCEPYEMDWSTYISKMKHF